MSKRTPLIRLQAARRAYDAAAEACPHWDSNGDFSGAEQGCCREFDDAARELSMARKAARS